MLGQAKLGCLVLVLGARVVFVFIAAQPSEKCIAFLNSPTVSCNNCLT